MSNYFKNFPRVLYNFGSGEKAVSFQKLSLNVDIIDSIKDNVAAYIEYEIRDFERPDTLAHRLYGKSEYEWTFFLMNDHLKEQGWPMSLQDLYEYATTEAHSGYVATLGLNSFDSAASLVSTVTLNASVTLNNGSMATISRVDLDNDQVYLTSDSDLSSLVGSSNTLTIGSSSVSANNIIYEYDAVHHYVDDSDQWVDLFGTSVTKTPVSNLEHLSDENDLLKKIRIIKKQNIESIVSEFNRAITSN